MVAGVGFEPTTFGICVPRQLSLLRLASASLAGEFVVWTIPSPCLTTCDLAVGRSPCYRVAYGDAPQVVGRGCPPSSLYPLPRRFASQSEALGPWLGITSKGFTEFDGIHPAVSVPGSPGGRPIAALLRGWCPMSPTSYLTAPPRSEFLRATIIKKA